MHSDDVVRAFNAAGASYRETGASFLGHFADLLIDALNIQPGDRVVDLATGPGTVAGPLAAKVGSQGSVLGIDLAEGQLDIARLEAAGPVRYLRMDATALRLPDRSADAVTCGFGLPYFEAPGRAVREASRILRRGGQMAFSTWSEPWFGSAGGALSAALEHRELSNVRGHFTHTPAKIAQFCFAAGLSNVVIEEHTQTLVFPSLDAWWAMNLAFAFLVRLETIEPQQQVELRADLEANPTLCADDGTISTSVGIYLLRATA
jgi:ubiquinone/menaquinone biosynthesis C-methylase UbiE